MYRRILILCCGLFVVLTQNGCFGLIVGYPENYSIIDPKPFDKNTVATKTDFLKHWGEPDLILDKTDTSETWQYKRHHWCGIMPAFFIMVPLVLPVCSRNDRIIFYGDTATGWVGYKMWTKGLLMPVGGPINEFFPSPD